MRDDELTPKQAAELLGVSESTVRRYEQTVPPILEPSRRLPGSGHRRYSRSDVERLARDGAPTDTDGPDREPGGAVDGA